MSELYVQNTNKFGKIDYGQGKVREFCFTQIVDTLMKSHIYHLYDGCTKFS